jgi:hypothetical protein
MSLLMIKTGFTTFTKWELVEYEQNSVTKIKKVLNELKLRILSYSDLLCCA